MAEVGAGLGIGVEDLRVVCVFHNAEVLDGFLLNGVIIGANASASAKLDDKGEASGGELIINNMSIHQMTDNGLAVELMVSGTKYWPDASLN